MARKRYRSRRCKIKKQVRYRQYGSGLFKKIKTKFKKVVNKLGNTIQSTGIADKNSLLRSIIRDNIVAAVENKLTNSNFATQ